MTREDFFSDPDGKKKEKLEGINELVGTVVEQGTSDRVDLGEFASNSESKIPQEIFATTMLKAKRVAGM